MSAAAANGSGDLSARRGRSRARSIWRAVEWPLVGALVVAALVLGYVGFGQNPGLPGAHPSFLDRLYLSVQLFPLQSGAIAPPIPWALEVARFLAPALTVYVAAKALLAVFRDQVWRLRARLFLKGHVVVCGLGARGMELTAQFLARGYTVVVIESDIDNPLVESCRDRGAHVIVGDATDETVLRLAAVPAAGDLVAVLPEDGDNAEVAVRARRLSRRARARPLTVHAHVADLELCDLLRARDAGGGSAAAGGLRFFNVLETGARMMLDELPLPAAAPDRDTRYVVVGLGKMGRSLVHQVAREWPLTRRNAGERLHLTLIDALADEKAELLRLRHPYLDETCDLDVLQMDKNAADFERAAFLRGPGGEPAVAVFLCFDDDVHVLVSALTLDGRTGGGIPIVMRMSEKSGLAALLDDERAGIAGDLRPVPLLEWSCDPDLLLRGEQETLARALFAGARRHDETCAGAIGEPRGATAAWHRLTPAQRDDWRVFALQLDDLLGAVGCRARRSAGLIPAFSFSAHEIGDLAQHDWPLSDGGGGVPMAARREAARAIPIALARAGYAITRHENDAAPAGETVSALGEANGDGR